MSQNNFHFWQNVLSGLVCLALLSSSVVPQAGAERIVVRQMR